MKKILSVILLAVIIGGLDYSCSNDGSELSVSKKDVLAKIKLDIANRKFYPNVKNKFENSGKNLEEFLNQNVDLVNFKDLGNETGRESISKERVIAAIVEFNRTHGLEQEGNENEVRSLFELQQANLVKYGGDYIALLNGLVADGTIPSEEKEILISYIDYYYDTEDFNELVNLTGVFVEYVNESDFSEFEKNGMLSLFETFKTNRKLFDTIAPFNFLEFMGAIPVGPDGKPSRDTACGGTMLAGMLTGSLGGPAGFVGGTIMGAWSCYCMGCFD